MPYLFKNWEVAEILHEAADLLKLKAENPFKIRAYESAAAVISRLPVQVSSLSIEDMKKLPGVGNVLAEKIYLIMTTGSCPFLSRLYEEVPKELRILLKVPGLGQKGISKIMSAFSPHDLEELNLLLQQGEIASLPGMGVKAEQALSSFLKRPPHWSVKTADLTAKSLQEQFALAGFSVVPVGSLRRHKESIKRIELLAAGNQEDIGWLLNDFPLIESVKKAAFGFEITTRIGLAGIVRVCTPEDYPWKTLWFTGSESHLKQLSGIAESRGFMISVSGFYSADTAKKIVMSNEEEYYQLLGLSLIPPELRKGEGEIDAALKYNLPQLVEVKDVKGDLHLHSVWSDGREEIDSLIEVAHLKGYQYLAVTDHSQTLKIAHGLTPERLSKQGIQISGLIAHNRPYVFKGIEVDILPDGSLDLPDETLLGLDIVIASVHSAFNQSRQKMTERILKAIAHPAVTAIGHPTGRLLSRRPAYAVDVDSLLRTAAGTGTWIEINSNPDRLDLSSVYLREAKKMGIKLIINTDAHDSVDMDDIIYGVEEARRGWLGPADIVNTLPLEEFKEALKVKKAGKKNTG